MKRRLAPTKHSRAVAIALLLVGTFVGKFHEAFVPHRICAEHGEIVEVSGSIAPRHQAAESSAHTPRISDSKSRETSHEHCGLAWFGRIQELLVDAQLAASLPPSQPQVSAPCEAACAHTSVPLLMLAPKQSPPAIG
jgi:hypothetical protein